MEGFGSCSMTPGSGLGSQGRKTAGNGLLASCRTAPRGGGWELELKKVLVPRATSTALSHTPKINRNPGRQGHRPGQQNPLDGGAGAGPYEGQLGGGGGGVVQVVHQRHGVPCTGRPVQGGAWGGSSLGI